jgi:hypothetical protein
MVAPRYGRKHTRESTHRLKALNLVRVSMEIITHPRQMTEPVAGLMARTGITFYAFPPVCDCDIGRKESALSYR